MADYDNSLETRLSSFASFVESSNKNYATSPSGSGNQLSRPGMSTLSNISSASQINLPELKQINVGITNINNTLQQTLNSIHGITMRIEKSNVFLKGILNKLIESEKSVAIDNQKEANRFFKMLTTGSISKFVYGAFFKEYAVNFIKYNAMLQPAINKQMMSLVDLVLPKLTLLGGNKYITEKLKNYTETVREKLVNVEYKYTLESDITLTKVIPGHLSNITQYLRSYREDFHDFSVEIQHIGAKLIKENIKTSTYAGAIFGLLKSHRTPRGNANIKLVNAVGDLTTTLQNNNRKILTHLNEIPEKIGMNVGDYLDTVVSGHGIPVVFSALNMSKLASTFISLFLKFKFFNSIFKGLSGLFLNVLKPMFLETMSFLKLDILFTWLWDKIKPGLLYIQDKIVESFNYIWATINGPKIVDSLVLEVKNFVSDILFTTLKVFYAYKFGKKYVFNFVEGFSNWISGIIKTFSGEFKDSTKYNALLKKVNNKHTNFFMQEFINPTIATYEYLEKSFRTINKKNTRGARRLINEHAKLLKSYTREKRTLYKDYRRLVRSGNKTINDSIIFYYKTAISTIKYDFKNSINRIKTPPKLIWGWAKTITSTVSMAFGAATGRFSRMFLRFTSLALKAITIISLIQPILSMLWTGILSIFKHATENYRDKTMSEQLSLSIKDIVTKIMGSIVKGLIFVLKNLPAMLGGIFKGMINVFGLLTTALIYGSLKFLGLQKIVSKIPFLKDNYNTVAKWFNDADNMSINSISDSNKTKSAEEEAKEITTEQKKFSLIYNIRENTEKIKEFSKGLLEYFKPTKIMGAIGSSMAQLTDVLSMFMGDEGGDAFRKGMNQKIEEAEANSESQNFLSFAKGYHEEFAKLENERAEAANKSQKTLEQIAENTRKTKEQERKELLPQPDIKEKRSSFEEAYANQKSKALMEGRRNGLRISEIPFASKEEMVSNIKNILNDISEYAKTKKLDVNNNEQFLDVFGRYYALQLIYKNRFKNGTPDLKIPFPVANYAALETLSALMDNDVMYNDIVGMLDEVGDPVLSPTKRTVDIENINPELKKRLLLFGKLQGKNVQITSGYRSIADQKRLYNSRPGYAAKPGTSLHNFGVAADVNTRSGAGLGLRGDIQTMKNLKIAGLIQPMPRKEPWHLEMVETGTLRRKGERLAKAKELSKGIFNTNLADLTIPLEQELGYMENSYNSAQQTQNTLLSQVKTMINSMLGIGSASAYANAPGLNNVADAARNPKIIFSSPTNINNNTTTNNSSSVQNGGGNSNTPSSGEFHDDLGLLALIGKTVGVNL